MSKLPMKRVFITGLKSECKYILEALQRAGVVEIDSEEIKDDDLKTMDVIPEKVSFDRYKNQAYQALDCLSEYVPDTSGGLLASLEGPKEIDKAEYEKRVSETVQKTIGRINKILSLQKQIAEDKASIPKAENKIMALQAWTGLDLPMNYEGTDTTAAFIGTLKNQVSLEEIVKGIEEYDPDSQINPEIQIVGGSKEMTCIFAVCLKEDAHKVDNALKAMGFARAGLSERIPTEEIAFLKKEITRLKEDIEKCIEEIKTFSDYRDDIKLTADYYTMRSEKYEVLSKLPQSENAFFVNGFVPLKYADALKENLEKQFEVDVELTDPSEDDDVPVLLQNNFFAEPMETVVESYSLPNKNEIDTSGILSIFYYVLFGLLLYDAGYGLLLTLGCGIALFKVKNMQKGMKKLLKLFFFSGISTMFWGFMFGSFFGDAVGVIASTFFHSDFTLKPLWFEPINAPIRMLAFSFLLAIIHLFTGLFVKGYLTIKQKDYEGFICDVLFWAMFVGGGIAYLLSMEMITSMMGLSFRLGLTAAKISSYIALAGAAGVVLTGGRESKNWGKRIMKGAYAAYGVTGWLSDILSYSRLLALGLATGVIAQVFNKMGSMLGATWYGILIFIVVFLVGHVLNLGINILGAYVHTNRLQFVEFFGKFYEGGGREYTPFTEKTKYYNVTEANIKEEK